MNVWLANSDDRGPLLIFDLPQELVDHIIDHLREDATALTACSLTHRSMRFRAQSHLFRTISVTPQRWTECKKLVEKSPHLGYAVRRLRLTQPVPLLFKFNVQDSRGFAHLTQAQSEEAGGKMEIVPMFPAALKLDLRMLDHAALSVPLLRQACDPTLVQSIRMSICVVPTMACVVEFICSFPRLKKLVVSDLFTKNAYAMKVEANQAIEDPVPTKSCPLIETLRFPSGGTLGEVSSISLTKWLFEQSMHVHLTTLEITVVSRGDAATLSALLQDLGPRLQHLYLGVEQLDADSETPALLLTLPLLIATQLLSANL